MTKLMNFLISTIFSHCSLKTMRQNTKHQIELVLNMIVFYSRTIKVAHLHVLCHSQSFHAISTFAEFLFKSIFCHNS